MREFGERATGVLNEAALGYLLSIGHRTGLFDVLDRTGPATAAAVAERAGLNERYVREWLDGATVGRVLEHHAASSTYRLPAEHAAFLTRRVGASNVAASARFLAMFGSVENDLVECFRSGGGVPYSRFPAFQALMSESSAAGVDSDLLDRVLPLADGLVDRLERGVDVLDVGCGRGHTVNVLAGAFPASRFAGVDLSSDGIIAARAEAQRLGLDNVGFEVQDVVAVPGQYDVITGFDIVHDQVRPKNVLAAIHAALRPDGLFFCMDIAADSNVDRNVDHVMGPWLYAFSLFHCMTVSLAEGGEGLGSMWGEGTALAYLRGAGFRVEEPRRIEGDPIHVYYVCHRS
jgi:2-polyprenyl-3-methyl-5-hydroxy-6-metoxy-1,4-benzoquinol methylase